jgi:release factor glutamine methyltransferase
MQRFTAYIKSKLDSIYPDREIKVLSRILLQDLAGWDNIQVYTGKDTKIPEETLLCLFAAVDRLVNYEPVQYITGVAHFFDLKFQVRPGVLIPRPETEELVALILADRSSSKPPLSLHLLDIGTGSGCIAVSLAKRLPDSVISAWDISTEALCIAQENARLNEVSINFKQVNILNTELSQEEEGRWDIIVSNPPYVRLCEKAEMERRVLSHEPHLALFVEDEDALLFYRVITHLAHRMLKKEGLLYFEINSHLGPETLDLIRKLGFKEAILIKDISGKNRIIRARL